MWCWYRQVTLTANAVYFLIAWPGGVREGRAAFATLSDSPRRFSHISKYEQVFRIYPENSKGFPFCLDLFYYRRKIKKWDFPQAHVQNL